MNHSWTPEMLRISAVVAVILMATVIFTFCIFRQDKFMIPVACFLIFILFVYQPVMKMEKQECERARAQALQKPQTVNIWLGSILVMTVTTDRASNSEPVGNNRIHIMLPVDKS